MTCFAEKKVESRVQKVLKARGQAVPDIPTPFCSTRSMQSKDGSPLQFDRKSLAQSTVRPPEFAIWKEEAVNQFFEDYVVASDTVPDTMNVLPQLYRSLDADFCFNDALYAAAFVSQANQLGLEWIAIEANEAYGRALTTLMSALQDDVEALKDTTLGATYLISMYEVRYTRFTLCRIPVFPSTKADPRSIAHWWSQANRWSYGSSSPSWTNVITSPTW